MYMACSVCAPTLPMPLWPRVHEIGKSAQPATNESTIAPDRSLALRSSVGCSHAAIPVTTGSAATSASTALKAAPASGLMSGLRPSCPGVLRISAALVCSRAAR